MRRLLLTLPLIALASATFGETREERVAVAQDYVALALRDFDMEALFATMWAPMVAQVESSGVAVSTEQRTKIQALYTETFAGPMTALMQDQAALMADMMTLGEITALRDFYATPDGRSVMAKLPQLTQAQQPGVMKLINEKMPLLMPKVLEIVNGGP